MNARAGQHQREFKLVVLGAGGVGKSALTIQFAQRHFVEEYDPTIEDNYRMVVTLDMQDIVLDILDTAGQEEYAAMRDQYMRSGDGFLLCYSIISRPSFDEVSRLYARILRVKDVEWFPVVLVATKADLGSLRVVSVDEGIDAARRLLGGATFVETSARVRVNVDEAFLALARTVRDAAIAAGAVGRRKSVRPNSEDRSRNGPNADALSTKSASRKGAGGRRRSQGYGEYNAAYGNGNGAYPGGGGGVGTEKKKGGKCVIM
ncbi:hypothetical protein DFJ73DRAFT_225486 [Zopfochytrium polystomum]|nr:hypothetical protein DFJ73DRAFT_225486 [Zopfochytrium polystomum]